MNTKRIVVLFAVLACGMLSAAPNLRFGFITDTHIDETASNLSRMRGAFTLFKTNGVDLVVHGGDLANAHYPVAYAAISNLFDEVFGVPRPRFIAAVGNHDTQNNLGALTPLEAAVETLALAGAENAHTGVSTVNGYAFLTMPYAIGDTARGFLSWADYETAVSNACVAAGAGRPVFVLEHEPPQDTTYNTHNWGYAASKAILSRYPQVVELSGHVHGSLRSDLFLWQGAFTVLNAGCLDGWQGLLMGVPAEGGQNKSVYEALIVEVYGDRIVALRHDVTTGEEIGRDSRWTIPLPFDAATAPYDREKLTAAEVAPEFASGDVLTVTPGASCQTFELAFPEVPVNALTYWITVESWNGTAWTRHLEKEVFSEFWKQTAAKTGRAKVALSDDAFEPGATYRFSVQPVGQYGAKGAAIRASATAAKAGDTPDGFVEYVRSTGKQYFDTGVIGRGGTKMALDVVLDEVGGDTAILDCRKDESASRFFLFHTDKGNAAYGYGDYCRQEGFPLVANRRYHVESELKSGLQTLDIDGVRVATANDSRAIDTGANLYLFACNFVSRGNPALYPIKARVYGLRIWQTGADGAYRLVRDLVPCMAFGGNDPDGSNRRSRVGALYDRVTGRILFAHNKDDRTLSAAASERSGMLPDVWNTTEPGRPDYFVDYIRSTGSQVLDTGVRGRSGLKVECDLMYHSSVGGAEEVALGISSSGYYTVADRPNGRAWGGFGAYGKARYFTNETTGVEARWELGRKYHVVSDCRGTGCGDSTITRDGEVIYRTPGEDMTLDRNLMLFASARNGFPAYTATVRCYGLRLWQDGMPVRDFRPCMKGGRPGLYDEVRNEVVFPLGDMSVTAVGWTVNEDGSPVALPWVQTTGSQFVDLDVVGKSGTRIEMEFLMPNANNSGDHGIIGARGSSTTDTRFYPIHNHANCGRLGYVSFKSLNDELTARTRHRCVSDLRAGSQVLTIDGEEVYRGTDKSVVDTGVNLYLGAVNVGGVAQYVWPVRVYSLKIWQTATTAATDTDYVLVRDFTPAFGEGNDGSSGALYDRVSGRFFKPQDTNTTKPDVRFRVLDNVPRTVEGPPDALVEYIESDGRQLLDTGVAVGPGLRVEGEVMWTGFFGQEQTHLGAHWYPNRLYLSHYVNGSVWFGYTQGFGRYPTDGTGAKLPWGQGVRQRYVVDFADPAHLKATIDGKVIMDEDASSCTLAENSGTLGLFAANMPDYSDYFSKSRCYGMTFKKNGALLCDFRPCVKDGQGGLYDTVSGRVYLPVLSSVTGGLIGPMTNGSDLVAHRYVEYVESDGSSWIDTGVIGRSGTKALVEFTPVGTAFADGGWSLESRGVLGAKTQDWGDNRLYLAAASGGVLCGGYGELTATAVTLATGVTHRVESELRGGVQRVTVDGDEILSASSAATVDTGLTLYLGAVNVAGEARHAAPVRIHRVKIWQTATTAATDAAYELVRDYEPVVTKAGIIGLRDAVEGKIALPAKPFAACGKRLRTGACFIMR